eukprot:TRINITY_DN6563_c0_g1_i2.p1 TRINITY_DN6563_c0_g1~~TRINITY_DN6563_c0_g1_i2.p1  ORF type:complete len:1018 (-),score=147.67 TRINITY_DN6563_c0_g1_i2:116-3169(-)
MLNKSMTDMKYGGLHGATSRESTSVGRARRTTAPATAVDTLQLSPWESGQSPICSPNESQSRVEICLRDVRSVADAQGRLLRVVEGISEELSKVSSAVATVSGSDGNRGGKSSADEVRAEVFAHIAQIMSTMEELQRAVRANGVDGAGGTAASRLARHDAEISEILRSRAEESVRTNSAVGELQRLVGGIGAQIGRLETEVTELRRAHNEITALNSASMADLQHKQQVEFQRLQLASNSAATQVTQHEAEIADLRRSLNDIFGKHNIHIAEFQTVKQHASQVPCHEAKILEIERLQLASAAEQKQRAIVSEQSEMQGSLLRRVDALQTQFRDEVASLQKTLVCDIRGEMRGVMQSHAAAIKALDEQLWLVDEQLWQTERRLTGRIDEISQVRSSSSPTASAGVGVGSDTPRSQELSSPCFSFSNEGRGSIAEAHSQRGGDELVKPQTGADSDGGDRGPFPQIVHQKGYVSTLEQNESSRVVDEDRRPSGGSFLPSSFVAAADELASTVDTTDRQQCCESVEASATGPMEPLVSPSSPMTPELQASVLSPMRHDSRDGCDSCQDGGTHVRSGASAGHRGAAGDIAAASVEASINSGASQIVAPAPPSAQAMDASTVLASQAAFAGKVLPAPVASTSCGPPSTFCIAGMSFPRPVRRMLQSSFQQVAESPIDLVPEVLLGQALRVTIGGATGIRLARASGVSGGGGDAGGGGTEETSVLKGPYCVCEVPGRPRSRSRTEAPRNTTEMVWNHEVAIHDYIPGEQLIFTIWDDGTNDRHIARAVLDGSQVKRGFEGALELLDVSSPASLDVKVAPGIIFPRRLRVSICGASGLGHLNMSGESPWCLCEVRQDKRTTKTLSFHTQTVANSLDPVWNETMDLDPWLLGDALDFFVRDRATSSGLMTEGRVSVPSEMFFPHGFDQEVPILLASSVGDALTRSGATLRLRILPVALPEQWRQAIGEAAVCSSEKNFDILHPASPGSATSLASPNGSVQTVQSPLPLFSAPSPHSARASRSGSGDK